MSLEPVNNGALEDELPPGTVVTQEELSPKERHSTEAGKAWETNP